ncbi:hypothetical protein [Trinickia dinghuensis]|uniref:Uncharacterized protein n=1 Tax=Trinickia dinghuensis TaxID=2291023 RepID=A0A3D8JUH7_9BURK|nr:hypothetical protein [Trinickia dinghuensis]RDU96727.1 hypothetical protein DWV00_22295 [Trinickia dinghuensis]
MKLVARMLLAVCTACLVTSCAHMGPTHLKADQVDYARALGMAKKRAILDAMVQLRFADAPSFLTVSQIIAAYTFDATVGTTLNEGSGAQPNYALANGSVSYSNHPTFTFTPTTGDAFATAYIRPLAPTLVLPLAQGGIPIDLLLRISAQSIDGLLNGTALGGSRSAGTPGFFQLIHAARRLQLAGELNVELRNEKGTNHVFLVITVPSDSQEPPGAAADRRLVKQLLHLPHDTGSFEVVYGQTATPGRIALMTRSALGILTDLGAQIDVPAASVASGATKPTVGLIGGETRSTIVVHSGSAAPTDAYVAIPFDKTVYWIDSNDFDSKYAFTVVQDLMALAEADTSSKAPIVTIPAG